MNPLKPLVKISPAPPLLKPPPKAGSVHKKTQEWQSAGVRQKPTSCSLCLFSQVGTAFVPDDIPSTAKMVYVFSHPRQADAAEQKPLSGAWGQIIRKLLIEDLGREESEVGLAHVIRCMPKKMNTRSGVGYQYPAGAMQRAAESNCRSYDNSSFREGLLKDGGLIDFAPDVFLVTLDTDSILEVGAFKYMIQQDVKKAWGLVNEGHRVAVLFGSEVLSVVAGFLQGGAKKWRGHFYEGSWPFAAQVRREGFR